MPFIIEYNGSFLRPPIPLLMTGPDLDSKAEKVKFVDDGTVAVSINLKKCLVNNPCERPRPLNYREGTKHILPPENNLLQLYLDDTEKFTKENRNGTFHQNCPLPMLSLEYVQDMKLVEVVVSEDLRLEKNTSYICKRQCKGCGFSGV